MNVKSYIRKANYYETDQMFNVHHSNHIRYFEEARIDFMNQIGCNVKELEEQGLIIPVVGISAKYNKPIRFDDEIRVEISLTYFNGVRMEFDYTIYFTETNEIAATGHSEHCFINGDRKPLNAKKCAPTVYETMKMYVKE